ncbi:MAG: class I adenylate-forming enzyme family protein, partial [Pseudolabrys sp.]
MLQTDLIAPVPELLRRHARERGAKIAYRDAHSQVTYAELLDRTGRIAGHLADNGVEPRDTVAIMLPNSVQWVEACFGITRGGAIGVPISYDSSEPEIAYRLADANCKAVFTTAERADLFVKLQRDAPNLKTLIVADRGLSGAKALRYRDLIGKAASSAPRDPPLMHEP